MAQTILDTLMIVGVVLVGGFVVAGLASPRIRRLLQRPAQEMLDRDREQWCDSAGAESGRVKSGRDKSGRDKSGRDRS